uniref:Uncharacterized protein n=1 Tax=Arundo donax TaxID=35708 RepID=A0A0A9GU60_ARUDO
MQELIQETILIHIIQFFFQSVNMIKTYLPELIQDSFLILCCRC